MFLFNFLSQVCLYFFLSLSFPGHTGRFIKALFSTSLLFMLAHVCFQICLYTVPGLDDALGHNCDDLPSHNAVSCSPGITLPSAFSAVYFLLFIGVCTWWACRLPISHLGFSVLCVMVGFFAAGHLICLYLYQSVVVQSILAPSTLWARLFGLKDIIKPVNCSSTSYDLILNTEHDWPVYVNPGILLLLYVTVATVLKISSHVYEKVLLIPLFNHPEDDTKVSTVEQQMEEDSPLHLVGRMVMQQSYICALVAMMVWSITYHSWLTFVLLLWACVIWMWRARRDFAMLCSPFILLYGVGLCSVQYIWAMDLERELPQQVGSMSLQQMGLDRPPHPCLRLGAMLLFTLTFWLLLRHSVKDKFCRKKRAVPLQEVTTGGERLLKLLGRVVMRLHAKYWIYVCGGMFIMVSFAGKLAGYKIIYMLLFLLCMCLYQVYYSLWRRLLKAFWWLVVAYTMLVLITIYTFQFEDFPGYWRNFTGFTDDQLADLGLETFKLSELFPSILIPGFFLLACILQLHYFHEPFMTMTDLEHVTPVSRHRSAPKPEHPCCLSVLPFPAELMPSKWGLVMDRLMVLFRKFSDVLTHVQAFLWRILELHILKIVAFFVVWVALSEPCVMNSVLVVLWSFAMPYPRFRPMASCLSTVWVCILIVCKMLYQLSIVKPEEYSTDCPPFANETSLGSDEIWNSTLYKAPVDPANWFGVRKNATALDYSKNHLMVLLLLVFEVTVYRHQTHHYRQLQRSPPTIPTIFPQATRDMLDLGLLPCLKYLLNFSFYKFGLEICFLMTVNVIGQRMNFLVIIHGCWLVAIMVRRRRAAIANIWPKYCLFLVVFMIYQYILCVGIPPTLCIDYPWRWKTSVTINSALIKWIFLPDFHTLPNSKNLIADFLLLMCVSQQLKVFENEKKEEWMVMGGENKDNPDPMEDIPFNPTPNFINCRSYLDMAKVLVFRYMFWFVLAVVFVTGSTRISVFGLGYLLACFFFLLIGTKLLMKASCTRLLMWDCLIMYNVAVIISKNVLSILACVFVAEMQSRFCWVIQLFSLVCTVKGYYDPATLSDEECSLPVEEAGIIWDSICFFFLLLQRRVFLSFYFLHVSADLQASAQQGFNASLLCVCVCVCVCVCASFAVLHSGDYYLFESDSGEEEDLIEEEQKQRRLTAFQVSHTHRHRHRQTHRHTDTHTDIHARACCSVTCGCSPGSGSDTVQRILDVLKFLWVLCLAMVDSFTLWLTMLTKQHVDTSTVLCEERHLLIHGAGQERRGTQVCPRHAAAAGQREGVTAFWCYILPLSFSFCRSAVELEEIGESEGSRGCDSMTLLAAPPPGPEAEPRHLRRQRRSRTASELLADRPFSIEELEQSRAFYSTQNRLLKLLFALCNVLAAHSELVCYLIIVLNNMVTASVISLVLPVLTFLWAMLSVPRPSKKFWMTAIIYTEVMVVVKYLFQFGFFPWNSEYEMKLNENKPFFLPRILGLEKTDNYIRYDLLQLLALFFHRSLLQRYGLWDEGGPPEENSSPSSQEEKRSEKEQEEVCTGLSNLEDKTVAADGGALSPADVPSETQPDPEQNQSTEMTPAPPAPHEGQGKKRGLMGNIYMPAHRFFKNILHAEDRAATDVYALMFLTDVVDFIIIVFGFWAFGKHSAAADIASTLSEDQVPEAFLVMLLIQFSTMVVDRALYLRKAMLGKLIFQILLVFGIHLWMFFILPAVTERMFSQNSVAQLWYFVKCIYFTLSAYQIRCGYPTRILGNFLTKKYNHLNLFLFQGFRLVPFLVELRAVMDWVWTDTTLSLSNWMCVEDIYANIFIIKCSRETEKKYPQPKGQKKKKIVKYGMGGLIIFFLICIIWFPLLFISLVRSVVGVVNHPVDVTVTVKLGGYEPLFTMSVQQQSIQPYTQDNYDRLTKEFGNNAVAMQFITLYSYEDIVTANIEGSSGSVWRISPPSRDELIRELLDSPADMTLRLAWTFQRDLGKGGTVENTFDKHSINLEHGNHVRADLASLLQSKRTDRVPHMFPNYIRAPNGAEAKPVSQLYEDEEGYLDMTLSLMRDVSLNSTAAQEWWDISIADCDKSSARCDVLPMVIFNDKVSPPSLGFLAGYGIMGLYVSVVLVIGKFVRGFFSEISHSIMFEELPCVDRILKLCTDIFLVRETGELELEEELYSKLIFLYRSPETMIKWTREKNGD
uniref:Piezo-type mechanosensitive ion channel component n=1 Tax=Electrophorus electricus TaxID=8005 RepID=A0A4W4GYY3_ELEEL